MEKNITIEKTNITNPKNDTIYDTFIDNKISLILNHTKTRQNTDYTIENNNTFANNAKNLFDKNNIIKTESNNNVKTYNDKSISNSTKNLNIFNNNISNNEVINKFNNNLYEIDKNLINIDDTLEKEINNLGKNKLTKNLKKNLTYKSHQFKRKEISKNLRKILDNENYKNNYCFNDEELTFKLIIDDILTTFQDLDNVWVNLKFLLKGQEIMKFNNIKPKTYETYFRKIERIKFFKDLIIKNLLIDKEVLLFFEVYQKKILINKETTELKGWSFINIFKIKDWLNEGKFQIPIYGPPLNKLITKDCIESLTIIKEIKIFLRITDLENKLLDKINENIDYENYIELEIHMTKKIKLNFYKGFFEDLKQRRNATKELGDILEKDIKYIQDYLDNEKNLIEKIKEQENKITLDKLDIEKRNIQKIVKENLDPWLERIKKLQDLIAELEKKLLGEQDKFEILDIREDDSEIKYGLKLYFQYLCDFPSNNEIRVKFDYFLGNEYLFDDFGYKTKYLTDRIESPILFENQTDEIKDIDIPIFETHYIVRDFKRLLEYAIKKKLKIYLRIHIYELLTEMRFKDLKETNVYRTSYLMEEESELIGWTFMTINYKDRIRLGRFFPFLIKPPLQNPPFNTDIIEFHEKLNFDFIIESFKYTQSELPMYTFRRRRKKRKSKEEIFYDKYPYVENLKPHYSNKIFPNGGNIDIYVDGARYLPDSITATKIFVRIIDSNLKDIVYSQSRVCNLYSNIYNPTYNYRQEIRLPFYDPTLMILVTLLTIEEKDKNYNTKIIGYSFFPLFINEKDKRPVENNNEKNFMLHNGCYQIPIYSQEFYKKKPFIYRNQKKLDKLPCATLLIRVNEAPTSPEGYKTYSINDFPEKDWERLGIWPKAPLYKEGKYNNTECKINKSEKDLFEFVLKFRKEILCITKSIDIILNKNENNLINGNKTNEEIEYNISNYLEKIINIKFDTRIINLKYFAKYKSDAGFKLSIDGFHNIPKKGIFVCVYCLNPPGTLYKDEVDRLQIQINSNFDWNSPLRSPKFIDGYLKVFKIDFEKTLHYILEIREVVYDEIKKTISLKEFGWTIVPIFTFDGYVNSGIFQIPVFKGKIKKNIITDLGKSNNIESPWEKIMNYTKKIDSLTKKKVISYLKPMSVIFRLLDGQREGHLQVPFDYTRIDYSYIPKNEYNNYSYNEAVEEILQSENKLSSILNNISAQEMNKKVTDACINAYKMKHYRQRLL